MMRPRIRPSSMPVAQVLEPVTIARLRRHVRGS